MENFDFENMTREECETIVVKQQHQIELLELLNKVNDGMIKVLRTIVDIKTKPRILTYENILNSEWKDIFWEEIVNSVGERFVDPVIVVENRMVRYGSYGEMERLSDLASWAKAGYNNFGCKVRYWSIKPTEELMEETPFDE